MDEVLATELSGLRTMYAVPTTGFLFYSKYFHEIIWNIKQKECVQVIVWFVHYHTPKVVKLLLLLSVSDLCKSTDLCEQSEKLKSHAF